MYKALVCCRAAVSYTHLADEPTGNLDSRSTQEIMEVLKELHRSGRTVILITHDDEIAAQVNRVIRIKDGKVEADFMNKDVYKRQALLNAPFFIPKDADLLRNRKVNTKKRQNRHLPELAFLILGTYFTAPFFQAFLRFLKNFQSRYFCEKSMVTVSYTHLDVYKRQSWHWLTTWRIMGNPCGSEGYWCRGLRILKRI